MRSVLNWLRTSSLVTVAVVCLIMPATRAKAGMIYDTTSGSGVSLSSNNVQLALSFQTTSTEYVINAVGLEMSSAGISLTGALNVSIYDATGVDSAPGAQLGTNIGSVDAASLSTIATIFSFTGLSRSLSPSTNYYIVITPDNLSGSYVLSGTSDPSGGIVTGSLGFGFNSPSWTVVPGNYIIGYVSASSGGGSGGAVPEPTSMAIFGLGALGFAYRNRRKLKK
jgi:hypothetical protein